MQAKKPQPKIETHPTKMVVLKEAPIDVEIIPLINWLNSFGGVKTLFCCQGESKPEHNNELPYVLFTCEWDSELLEILKTFKAFAGTFSTRMVVQIDHFNERIPFRYNMRWDSKNTLKEFIEFIKKTPEEIQNILREYDNRNKNLNKFIKMFGIAPEIP